ncbi:MAG: hypothetical protein UY48_C0015G0007 [Candidatus Gottesmanbacteria bacterium GW2011_GWB1_49_7]|uniref:Uncharacterized protein n=1 Tax=Candidatus Gottesmanbacteria bacterium GW2011_GWB1_49_7 TaxID=1618448 RepID=A0A0G1VYS7_9BACT|nr:MAG: hypothetical protein UY48_C0015G0007 [Candidatus Gottesmanbacteria bacterium GW2011_GWB1_49_7]
MSGKARLMQAIYLSDFVRRLSELGRKFVAQKSKNPRMRLTL